MLGKTAKGFSKIAGRYVRGIVYNVYANGIGILTDKGIAFIEHGGYEIEY